MINWEEHEINAIHSLYMPYMCDRHDALGRRRHDTGDQKKAAKTAEELTAGQPELGSHRPQLPTLSWSTSRMHHAGPSTAPRPRQKEETPEAARMGFGGGVPSY